MERGHSGKMYQVWMVNGWEESEVREREDTSFACEWRGKAMNGDCRPCGRDEWPGTHEGNGGETRARRILEEAKEEGTVSRR